MANILVTLTPSQHCDRVSPNLGPGGTISKILDSSYPDFLEECEIQPSHMPLKMSTPLSSCRSNILNLPSCLLYILVLWTISYHENRSGFKQREFQCLSWCLVKNKALIHRDSLSRAGAAQLQNDEKPCVVGPRSQ